MLHQTALNDCRSKRMYYHDLVGNQRQKRQEIEFIAP